MVSELYFTDTPAVISALILINHSHHVVTAIPRVIIMSCFPEFSPGMGDTSISKSFLRAMPHRENAGEAGVQVRPVEQCVETFGVRG